ncbi:MAG: DUF4241 domain-containing protein [Planctomycetaceae bacterium]|jgi:hypothetical protein|nr:DUF4241 domain-containing protein [Planctomycetaceae bacterium]
MKNYPTKEWLEKYEQIKNKLKPRSKLDEYFIRNKVCGKNIHILNMGNVNFPTGNIMVLDPLVYLTRHENPYFVSVPTGIFPLVAAVVEVEQEHFRYAAVKVNFNGAKVDYFVEALRGNENIDNFEEGNFFGFNVDAGLGTIVDVKTRDAYCDFIEKWEKENSDGNPYDDIFAKEFEKNYKINPKYQRKDGDWINYTIPGTDLSVPMFQSGFGDGVYPVYFGYDKNNNICQAVIEFIDIELAFGANDE